MKKHTLLSLALGLAFISMQGCNDPPTVTLPTGTTTSLCPTSAGSTVTRQVLVEDDDGTETDLDGRVVRRPRYRTETQTVANSAAGSDCSGANTTTGGGVVSSSLTTAANNSIIAGAATRTAGALISRGAGISTRSDDADDQTPSGRNVAETQMALAKPGGGSNSGLEKDKKDAPTTEIGGLAGGLGNSNLDTGQSGGGSSSNSPNGGGGGPSLSGDIKTSPVAEPKAVTSVKTAAEDTAYSSGGGGRGPAGGGGGSGEGYFGSQAGAGDGSGAGAQDTIAFLKEMPDVPPMSSADPEDYFSRINPAMTIFEVVSNRYRKKTMAWPLRLPASAEAKMPEAKIEAPKLDGVK